MDASASSPSKSRSQQSNKSESERELQQLRGYIRAFKRRRDQKDKSHVDGNDADDSRRGK